MRRLLEGFADSLFHSKVEKKWFSMPVAPFLPDLGANRSAFVERVSMDVSTRHRGEVAHNSSVLAEPGEMMEVKA